jgi:hypothetical protein
MRDRTNDQQQASHFRVTSFLPFSSHKHLSKKSGILIAVPDAEFVTMILLGLRQIRPAVPVISQHVIPRPLISPISGSRAISCRKCAPGSQFGTHMRAAYSTLQSLKTTALRLSDEVEAAIQSNIPIVALETTIYTHGFPYPDNVALALNLESVVRRNGAIPATIGVLNGVARVGLSSEEITTLASSAGKPETMKVSRRDLPYILGMVCHFIPTVFETRFHTSF